jgi:C4-dicarboxylate transporter DctM subunit
MRWRGGSKLMTALLFLVFLGCLLIGVPIAFSVAVAGVSVLIKGDVNLLIVVQRMFASTDSFALVAVPFFILAGDLLARGQISQKLVTFAESMLGMIRGGLSIVSVVAGMFFAAISGSGAATTAAVGATMVPELRKRGYNESSSIALIAAAGCIGVVIPPSVPMVLYAVIAGQSVTQLFTNGFMPGFFMGVILIVIALVQAFKYNYPTGSKFVLKNVWSTFKQSIWGLLMPIIILGGIFSGYFTPSEAAAVAVVYALIVSTIIYKDLTLKEFTDILLGSAKTSAVIMIIIACSGIFGWVLANWKIPEQIAQGILSVSTNKYILMFLISVIILIAGVFMETSSAVILLTPVFLPLIKSLGIDLVHFGIIFVIGISIGMITPPVAINLFVGSSITGLPIEKIAKSVLPYLLGLIIIFLLYVYLPLIFPFLII